MKLSFAFFIIFITSCRVPPTSGELSFEKSRALNPATSLSFKTIKQEIFSASCVSCHPGYANYNLVKEDIDAILASITSGRMPKNEAPLNSELQKLLREWIDKGLPTDGLPEPEPILAANWKSLSKKVFFPKCVQCHNPKGQASFLDLSSYEKFEEQKAYLLDDLNSGSNSYLVEVITDATSPMPPSWSNIPQLSTKEIETIIKWIDLKIPQE